jgi:chromosomal replication initiation ATPase DnaA
MIKKKEEDFNVEIDDATFLYKRNLEERLISRFKNEFRDKIGYYPQVITLVDTNYNLPIIDLSDLVNIINGIMNKEYGIKRYKGKLFRISSRIRKRDVTEYRYIYFKIGRIMGYSLSKIYNALMTEDGQTFDHTTVLHGCQTFDSLLETSVHFALKYQGVVDDIRSKFIKLKTDDNDGGKGFREQDACEEDLLRHEAGSELQVNM